MNERSKHEPMRVVGGIYNTRLTELAEKIYDRPKDEKDGAFETYLDTQELTAAHDRTVINLYDPPLPYYDAFAYVKYRDEIVVQLRNMYDAALAAAKAAAAAPAPARTMGTRNLKRPASPSCKQPPR